MYAQRDKQNYATMANAYEISKCRDFPAVEANDAAPSEWLHYLEGCPQC
jgi:hypothetical protein